MPLIRARIALAVAMATALSLTARHARAQMPSASRLPRALAGCYVLTVNEWMLPRGHFVPDSMMPRVITLDTLPVEHGSWRLGPDVGRSPDGRPTTVPRWSVTRDTLELRWSSGPRPTRILLTRVGAGAFNGYAVAEIEPRRRGAKERISANAAARRIACAGERPLPRATEDTARLIGDRLVVEPLGASFRLPPVWLGLPRPTKAPDPVCSRADGTRDERILTDRRLLPVVAHMRGEWKREFSAVVDSVMPLDALVAQAGSGRWSLDSHCVLHVQLRVYVGTFSPARLMVRAEAVGRRTARRFFEPVEVAEIDSAGWQGRRLSWRAWYHDYGGPAYVDVLARRVRGRTLAFVFMYVGATEGQLADRALVLESFQAEANPGSDDSPAVRSLLEAAARSEPDGYEGCYGGRESFAIIVEDSVTGRPLAGGARLIWRAGRTVDTTYALPTRMGEEPAVLQGPFGRPGTYDVVIRLEGYRDWSHSGIRVEQGAERCSIKPANIVLEARLAGARTFPPCRSPFATWRPRASVTPSCLATSRAPI